MTSFKHQKTVDYMNLFPPYTIWELFEKNVMEKKSTIFFKKKGGGEGSYNPRQLTCPAHTTQLLTTSVYIDI